VFDTLSDARATGRRPRRCRWRRRRIHGRSGFGAPHCTQLVTARIPVHAVSPDRACQLVADGAVSLPAKLTGRGAVLLNLVNGARRVRGC
jgi:hypothetical protein